MNTKTLVVVAHMDDETLWSGGYLMSNPGTHVLCCSVPYKDPERCIHFFEACAMLGAEGYIAGRLARAGKIDTYAAQQFAAGYDEIITHNHLGEYGHPAHIAVHLAMKELGKPMKTFGYGIITGGHLVDIEMKKRVLACYTSRPNVFENQSKQFDLSREAFI